MNFDEMIERINSYNDFDVINISSQRHAFVNIDPFEVVYTDDGGKTFYVSDKDIPDWILQYAIEEKEYKEKIVDLLEKAKKSCRLCDHPTLKDGVLSFIWRRCGGICPTCKMDMRDD